MFGSSRRSCSWTAKARRLDRLALAAAAFLSCGARGAFGAPYYEEPFSYAAGALTVTGSPNWTTHSGTAGQVQVIGTAGDSGASLAYAGLADPSGNRITINGTDTEDVNRVMASPVTSGDTYASFLVKATVARATAVYFAHFKDNTTNGFRGKIWAQASGDGVHFALSASSSNPAPTSWSGDLALNVTHFLVVRFNNTTGAAGLWVNPAVESFGAAGAPAPTLSDATGTPLAGGV
ncbi:MAG: hypothetical protein NTW86_29405, partial [Candidatus Sumerlaeota bacterium]|nr:hypothetical protein [Candidatus Sumerlaeota bacterium]